MVNKLPEVLEIGEIKLEPGVPFMYEAWGIRYRFSPTGNWRIAEMVFRKKSDARDLMERNYLTLKGMDGEVIPVKRTLLLDYKGRIKTETGEMTED